MSSITQAKAEAQKLIKCYNQLQAEAKNANAIEARHKAAEADKLVSQISALQLAITKLQAKERENSKKTTTKKVITTEKRVTRDKSKVTDRIQHLEEAQHKTQSQIEHLTRAKSELNRLKQQANKHVANMVKERRANNEKLKQELDKLISKKEEEQSVLKQELVSVKQQAQKDAESLKVQRDAARAMIERQKNLEKEQLSKPHSHKKLLIIAGTVAILALLTGFMIASIFTKPSVSSARSTTNVKTNITKKTNKKNIVKVMEVYQDKLKEMPVGPLMIKLSGGIFKMGSKLPYSDERPQHQVKLDSFSISKYEITFGEYDWFAGATGRQLPSDNSWGRGRRPVINVSWYDAVAYTDWLSEQTGYNYRLPSEREWEYAAAANSDTTYWWGYKLEKNYANCAICGGDWDGRQTAPVGKFKANKFGLHDVIGNVMEWTFSCFRPNYQNAPSVGNMWEWKKGKCLKRVVRSSSYGSYERELRTTRRNKFNPNNISPKIGFRIVREN
ncbi:SUMF1/EgtB/PvdO family nonheme iron enzyme [Thiotrichales bacterium HSG1]|nr:SUMF1/EgtB/PvdO family nonheme iron enzyme [Thiotrichales bacterium HSG1]